MAGNLPKNLIILTQGSLASRPGLSVPLLLKNEETKQVYVFTGELKGRGYPGLGAFFQPLTTKLALEDCKAIKKLFEEIEINKRSIAAALEQQENLESQLLERAEKRMSLRGGGKNTLAALNQVLTEQRAAFEKNSAALTTLLGRHKDQNEIGLLLKEDDSATVVAETAVSPFLALIPEVSREACHTAELCLLRNERGAVETAVSMQPTIPSPYQLTEVILGESRRPQDILNIEWAKRGDIQKFVSSKFSPEEKKALAASLLGSFLAGDESLHSGQGIISSDKFFRVDFGAAGRDAWPRYIEGHNHPDTTSRNYASLIKQLLGRNYMGLWLNSSVDVRDHYVELCMDLPKELNQEWKDGYAAHLKEVITRLAEKPGESESGVVDAFAKHMGVHEEINLDVLITLALDAAEDRLMRARDWGLAQYAKQVDKHVAAAKSTGAFAAAWNEKEKAQFSTHAENLMLACVRDYAYRTGDTDKQEVAYRIVEACEKMGGAVVISTQEEQILAHSRIPFKITDGAKLCAMLRTIQQLSQCKLGEKESFDESFAYESPVLGFPSPRELAGDLSDEEKGEVGRRAAGSMLPCEPSKSAGVTAQPAPASRSPSKTQ